MPNDQWKRTSSKRTAKAKVDPPKHSVVTLKGHHAYCPDHGHKTSNFQGLDSVGALFRCPETKDHTSHVFRVKLDPAAPKTIEEVRGWTERQLQGKLKEMGQG